MEILLIAAMAANRVIGRENRLPWHIPAELRLFKETTMGYPMVMGRRTFEALPGLLPGRRHIVLSRNPDFTPRGGERVHSLSEALQLCAGSNKVFIIGGAQIFAQTMTIATGIILTLIDGEVAGDVFFPEFSTEIFAEVSRVHHEGEQPFTVVTYQRRGEQQP